MRFNILLLIILGSCALSENIKEEETKNYDDMRHQVELVDFEFEERLNSFYDSETIENQDLYNLYEGKFPEEEKNPQKLRIHWKRARELALAELDLQKSIQKNWNDAIISERPILVLDKDGGDFYRYYEYRVISGQKYLGAIRIPTYRRTENFATAEVHLYSDDEKTYTIHPTAWGQYMAAKIKFDLNSSVYQTISNQIYNAISDTVAYNFAYRYLKNNPDKLPKFAHNSDMFKVQINNQITKKYNEDPYIQKLKNQVSLDPKWASESYKKFTDQEKTKNFDKINKNLEIQAYRIAALQMIDTIKDKYTAIQTEGLSIALLGSLQILFVDMGSTPKHTNSIKQELRQLFWKYLEENNFILINEFDISPLLDQHNISIELEFPNSYVDNSKKYLSDNELSKIIIPYVAWNYKNEQFKIYGTPPATRTSKSRPGADNIVIREELVSDFNDAIGDIIDVVGQMGSNIIEGNDLGFAKIVLDAIIKLAIAIAKLAGETLNIEGQSPLEKWFKDIQIKWEKIEQNISEGWGKDTVCNVINNSSKKAHEEMDKIFSVFKETLYGTKDPSTGLYSGGMCDLIGKINSLLASFTDSDGNSLTGLSPDDGQNISFLFELCDPNKKEDDVDDTLLKIMYTQMAGYGNEWSIPKKQGITHHLVHLSQSLDWGKKKFYHIDHKYIKPRNLTASEQKRYPIVAEGGYGAYARKKRDAWKAHGSNGW